LKFRHFAGIFFRAAARRPFHYYSVSVEII
jgi:hypothetical protein